MTTIQHRFVDFVPEELESGVVYISTTYKVCTHLCFCGCESEVALPLSPAGWSVRFNGETVSLEPSIGSWELPCQSHYWIDDGKVVWSSKWSRKRIQASMEQESRDFTDLYTPQQPDTKRVEKGILRGLFSRIFG